MVEYWKSYELLQVFITFW